MSRAGDERPVAWLVGGEGSVRRWAETARREGWRAVPLAWSAIVPVLPAEQVLRTLRDRAPDVVVITSANAARLLPAGAADGLCAACVGAATARAARRAGFRVVVTGDGDAASLSRCVAAWRPGACAVHLRGADATTPPGTEWEPLVAYRTQTRAGFERAVARAPEPRGVLVGSPRAAEVLAAALAACGRTPGAACAVVALGGPTQRRLVALGFEDVRLPERPDVAAALARLRG